MPSYKQQNSHIYIAKRKKKKNNKKKHREKVLHVHNEPLVAAYHHRQVISLGITLKNSTVGKLKQQFWKVFFRVKCKRECRRNQNKEKMRQKLTLAVSEGKKEIALEISYSHNNHYLHDIRLTLFTFCGAVSVEE